MKSIGSEEELMRTMRCAPTTDLQAQVLEAIDCVDKSADCSNNIKGPIVRDLGDPLYKKGSGNYSCRYNHSVPQISHRPGLRTVP